MTMKRREAGRLPATRCLMMSDYANCSGQRIPSKYLRDTPDRCRDRRCRRCARQKKRSSALNRGFHFDVRVPSSKQRSAPKKRRQPAKQKSPGRSSIVIVIITA